MKKETISDLTTEKTELKREIGAFGGVSIIAGIMIGSGIFYLGAYVLQRVGMNSGLALLCWIIGGVISLFGGLAYAEMGAAMPQSGGRVVYLNEAYHPIVGFMCGFVDWLIAGPGSVAALALALMVAMVRDKFWRCPKCGKMLPKGGKIRCQSCGWEML